MSSHPFAALTPEVVLAAVEQLGFYSDARIYPLNSYENRVYQVGLEEAAPLIAKFYRPNRWTRQQLLEEHQFTQDLAAHDIPVVQPLTVQGQSLFEYAGFYFALFPRQGGYAPEPGNLDQLYRLGQLVGRLHALGNSQTFRYRRELTVAHYGLEAAQQILQSGFLPTNLAKDWNLLCQQLLEKVGQIFQQYPYQAIRIHGDCHPGNLLYRDSGFFVVDFDDCKMGPAVQDLWMMLAGDRQEQTLQINELIEGYQEFQRFPTTQLHLIESLRTLRMLNYSAWLAQRWQDPAFPHSFPWFAKEQYWYEQLQSLTLQLEQLGQPALTLYN